MFEKSIDTAFTDALQIVSTKFEYLRDVLADVKCVTEKKFNSKRDKDKKIILDSNCSMCVGKDELDDHYVLIISNDHQKRLIKNPEELAFTIGWAAWVMFNALLDRGKDKSMYLWKTACNIRYEIEYGGHPKFDYFRRDTFIYDLRELVEFEKAPSLSAEDIYEILEKNLDKVADICGVSLSFMVELCEPKNRRGK